MYLLCLDNREEKTFSFFLHQSSIWTYVPSLN